MESETTLADEIAEMTVRMEINQNRPDSQEIYTIMLRAMLEIRRLQHCIRVLEGKRKE